MDITQILSIIGGVAGGGSLTALIQWLVNRRNQKRLNDNEVTKSNLDIASKYDELHNQFINRVRREEEQIDTLMERNRKLSDRLYDSEQTINNRNADLIEEKQRNADLRLAAEHNRAWRCILADCPDRVPKNPDLHGQTYADIDITVERVEATRQTEQITTIINNDNKEQEVNHEIAD